MQERSGVFGRFLGRPQTTADRVALSLLVSALVVICACCSCIFAPNIAGFVGLGSRGPTTTTLQTQPAATATAAPTHTPAPPEKPTIGAPDSAFAAAFSSRFGDQDWHVAVAGLTLDLHVIERAGNDGQQRIIFAALDPLPLGIGTVTFPQATGAAFVKQFLPADAIETKTQTGSDGAVTHLLHSASLAPLVPATAYSFGQPGDLYWMCNRVASASDIDNCEVGLA